MVFQPLELDAVPRMFWSPVEVLPLRRRTAPATVVVTSCIKRLCPTGRSAIGTRVKMKECMAEIGHIQKAHLHRGQKDIMQNFLICGNGNAVEGRGWTKVPMLPGVFKHYNDRALFFGYVGDFTGSDELYQGSVVSDGTMANNAEDDPHCTNHMHNFYRKMKCEPEMTPGSTCPTSYNCDALIHRSKDHCYHEGRKYPIGANISKFSVDFHTPCIESCQCVRLYEGVRFVCSPMSTNLTCPEAEGCQRFPFLDDFPCCQDGVSSCNNGKMDSVKCVYEGRSYSEGEKIIVSQDPTCIQCICASGFNGTISPQFCRKFSCALEFWGDAPIMLSRGCIPFYLSEEGCCPVAFRCPEPTDRVIKNKSPVAAENQPVKKCVFGNLTMAVGDRLSLWQLENGKEVNCSCTIPPFPSCVNHNFVLSDSFRREIAREGLEVAS